MPTDPRADLDESPRQGREQVHEPGGPLADSPGASRCLLWDVQETVDSGRGGQRADRSVLEIGEAISAADATTAKTLPHSPRCRACCARRTAVRAAL